MSEKKQNIMADRFFVACLTTLICLAGCVEPEGFRQPEDGLEAAREFIRSTLDGDYNKAEMYVSLDEQDLALFSRWQEHMRRQPEKERLGLKSSTILIQSVSSPNDSTTIVQYSNSYHRTPTRIVVVRHQGQWRVEFRETLTGVPATMRTDSLP